MNKKIKIIASPVRSSVDQRTKLSFWNKGRKKKTSNGASPIEMEAELNDTKIAVKLWALKKA